MKRIITFLSLALLAAGAADAQSFSAGARMGASCLWQGTDHKYISFDQTIFGRYETGKKWAFEAGFGHWGGGMKTNASFTSAESSQTVPAHAKLNNYEMNLSVQYDISCPYMQEHCPLMRRMKTFASLDISPVLSHTNLVYNDNPIYSSFYSETSHKKNDLQFWTGLSETMIYNLNDHFDFMSNAGFKINPAQVFSKGNDYQPNVRFSWQIGAAYRF